VDANIFVYHFSADPAYGAACTAFIKRVEQQEVVGLTSAHALLDAAHRLMTIEAIQDFGWPAAQIAARLRRHHAEISQASALSPGNRGRSTARF
jgi:predicted nucleic acid-binding protein